jgi:hypothetical protein
MPGEPVDSLTLRQLLSNCPPGRPGWQQFEEVALAALCHLLVPPLAAPRVQERTLSGIDRRDAVFPNRVTDTQQPWGLLRHDHDARLVLVEFKNYGKDEIGKDEVDQTRLYMKPAMGGLSIMVCNKPPHRSALERRNQVFNQEKKVILFLTTNHLHEMLDIKDRDGDPSVFILDAVDSFLLQHE